MAGTEGDTRMCYKNSDIPSGHVTSEVEYHVWVCLTLCSWRDHGVTLAYFEKDFYFQFLFNICSWKQVCNFLFIPFKLQLIKHYRCGKTVWDTDAINYNNDDEDALMNQ